MHELAIDLLSAARLLVSLLLFQLRNEFCLLGLQFLDLLFELMDELSLRFALPRTGLTLLGFESFLILAGPAEKGRGAFEGETSSCLVRRLTCCHTRRGR